MLHQGGNDVRLHRVPDQVGEEKSFNGTWTGTVPGQDGNPMDVTYEFEAVGKGVIGTISTKLGGGPFAEGKIDGNTISFQVKLTDYTIYTSGTLSGDVINMTQKARDTATQFAVKRAKPGPQ